MVSLDRSGLISGGKPNICLHSNSIDQQITFCITYSSQFQQVVRIVKRHLPLLCTHDQPHNIMGSGVRFINKKAQTLGTMLSPSLYINPTGNSQTWLTTKGFFRCGHKVCTACKFAKPNSHIFSFASNKNFPVKDYINCNTKHTVYLISCSVCRVQYVGCTAGPLKICIRRHLSDSIKSTISQISMASRHFLEAHRGDNSTFSFMGIARFCLSIRRGDLNKQLLLRESKWIFDLSTRVPSGLNVKQDVLY